MKSKQSVLVLETVAKASVPVIESCKAMGFNVIAGASKKRGCGLYSCCVDKKILYPSCLEKPEECKETLLNFLRKNLVEMLFPVGDIMTDLIAKYQHEFKKYTHLILPEYDVFVQGRNKVLTLKASARAQCPIPLTWYPDEKGVGNSVQEINTFPVLIKPAISAGSRGITLCRDRDEIVNQFPLVHEKFGECFIQEYVPQDGIQYKVDAVMDAEQNLLAGVVYEKLRYYPPNGGSSVLNKTVHRQDILDVAVTVMEQLKWVGLCDFDFIEDSRDGIIKLMEINPRFPESYRATVAAGVDMTKILYQLATGQAPQKQLGYAKDRYNRFLFGDIMWFLRTNENRFKESPSFFRFWGSDMYYQLIRKNDFGPICGYILENMEMLWNKNLRRERMR